MLKGAFFVLSITRIPYLLLNYSCTLKTKKYFYILLTQYVFLDIFTYLVFFFKVEKYFNFFFLYYLQIILRTFFLGKIGCFNRKQLAASF